MSDETPNQDLASKVAAMRKAVAEEAKQTAKSEGAPAWAWPIIAAVATALVEQGALKLFGYRPWHPYQLLPGEVIHQNATILLKSAPFVWPTLAGLAAAIPAMLFGSSGGKSKRADISCVLGGFRWDRNSFCRGWLCTGATGSGKTQSGVNPVMHQVFMREAGEEKETWEGSPLQAKTKEIQAAFKESCGPIIERRNQLEKELKQTEREREDLFQLAVVEGIDARRRMEAQVAQFKASSEHIKNEIEQAKSERFGCEKAISAVEDPEQIEKLRERMDEISNAIALMEAELDNTQRVDEIPTGPKQALLMDLDKTIAAKRESLDRIETEELYSLQDSLQRQMREIEQARYISYPWGGICVDEKGLYWQTLQGMARNYGREHHLMLLQTRPDWAPKGWTPPARFNLLSDDKIPANTYAKAIVDTAAAVSGGEGDKGFFKTQAESNIGWALTLQREVKYGLISKGTDSKSIAFPSIKLCLQLLSDKTFYQKWVQEHGLVQTKKKDPETGKERVIAPKIQSQKLTQALEHFMNVYWSQPGDQLGGVIGTIYNYLNYFTNDDVAEVFCADNTFDFRDIDLGMILCVAMPQKLQVERRYVCTLLKLLFYSHVLRRFDLGADNPRWKHRNLLICWQDEAQRFVTESDGNVDVIREAHATTFMACQAKPSLYAPLGGKEKAGVTILNLRNRIIFQAADDDCATGSADFLGKIEKTKISKSISSSGTSTSHSKEDMHRIKPHEFRALGKFTAVLCHADGKFRKVIICPITTDGKLRVEWLDTAQRWAYKFQTWFGQGWKALTKAASPAKG